ncbi:kinase-like domain-containing protein [Mycena alexandri]|uniref:Kinase-like domain-containing protein n=1 Tax=Mycena alexandri TaxID=1745969 RepID=A0AAD6WPL9_9AGAR|nr:kinase-like domain-containing protein [Mycena alexandri]
MAPELFLILGELPTETFAPGPTTMSSDVYSFGLLALEILNPTLQYRPTEPILTLKAHGSLRPRRSDYSVPSDVWTLLDTCWEPDPSLRPTIRDVILRMPLDTSEARILTQFKNVPGLFLALESLRAIIQDCQKLAQNRHVAGQLSNRCHRLLLELREQYTDDGNMKSTILRVSECLVEIRAKMNVWASQGTTKIQGYLQAQNVERDIEFCHSLLSICSMESDLLPHLDIVEGIHLRLNADKDRQDVLDYLATIAHAQSISQDILAAQQSDLTQLMSMILQFQSGLQHSTHEQNLSILWNRLQDQNSDLTSNLYLRPGEVVRIGRYPISVTRGFDVYEGLYLLKKVTMRVMRALDSSGNNLRRFRHECDIWGKLWNADDGRHILPFYGFCEDDGPLPYMVAPWMSNGTSLEYVRTGDGIDHMKLIKGIASGIEVLHTLSPSIIHGDIKGDNILIDDEGNPLIFNFGLSKFAEGTATDILFPSNQSGSASWQWLAPEASLGSGPSLASDIYSYGMTVLELLTHDKPWNIKNPSQVLIRAAQGEIPPRPMQPDVLQRGLDDNLWALLKCCWALQPEERPTIHKLLSTLSLL